MNQVTPFQTDLAEQSIGYSYAIYSGEFIEEIQLRVDPLDGGYLLPARTTLLPPPELADDQCAVFDEANNAWSIVADHRGQTAYQKQDGRAVIVSALGDMTAFATFKAPPYPFVTWSVDADDWIIDAVSWWTDIRSKRDHLLAESDWTEYSRRLSPAKKTEWLQYRDSLFDLPSTFASPADVVWPVKPN